MLALIGDAVVPATFHVTVFESPTFHVVAVLKDVTENAPAAALTVDTVIFTSLLQPKVPV
ncbi:MAG: hypothetical protein IPO94_00805 [Saprospiraceae bacterium]|nr:hypothetical protein [Saprospiraceae bacterium]